MTVNALAASLTSSGIYAAAKSMHRHAASISSNQENIMMRFLHASAAILAILSGITCAAAQTTMGQGSSHDLTARQDQMVRQGLASSPTQTAPSGEQPQVGNKLPGSMSAQAMPNDVGDRVPEVKNLLFVKLPDRIILIDPDTKQVTQIVANGSTTGSDAHDTDSDSNMNSSGSQSR